MCCADYTDERGSPRLGPWSCFACNTLKTTTRSSYYHCCISGTIWVREIRFLSSISNLAADESARELTAGPRARAVPQPELVALAESIGTPSRHKPTETLKLNGFPLKSNINSSARRSSVLPTVNPFSSSIATNLGAYGASSGGILTGDLMVFGATRLVFVLYPVEEQPIKPKKRTSSATKHKRFDSIIEIGCKS